MSYVTVILSINRRCVLSSRAGDMLGSAQSRPGGAGALTQERYPIIDRIGRRPRLDKGHCRKIFSRILTDSVDNRPNPGCMRKI